MKKLIFVAGLVVGILVAEPFWYGIGELIKRWDKYKLRLLLERISTRDKLSANSGN